MLTDETATGRLKDYGEIIADSVGNLLDFCRYGTYNEPIPRHCWKGVTVLEFINNLPPCGLDSVRKRGIWALRTGTPQPFWYKHPWLWDRREGVAIPVDNETLVCLVVTTKN